MKIFCIGFNKTGSTSLHVAIKELGFAEFGSTMANGEIHLQNLVGGNVNEVLNYVERNYEAGNEVFKDIPFSVPHFWKDLYKKYPDAIYVLSERDSSKQWYNSIYKFHRKVFRLSEVPSWEEVMKIEYRYNRDTSTGIHVNKLNARGGLIYDYLRTTFGEKHLPYDKGNMIKCYEAYNKEVKEFFKDKKNFISVNVSNDNDYTKLANFLGKKPLGNKFPMLNKT
jgi:hypothetical protein|tara:strand:- start:1442 stop:2113 length:672 start_codon:yes stop_codon:yes gene_type:complete